MGGGGRGEIEEEGEVGEEGEGEEEEGVFKANAVH